MEPTLERGRTARENREASRGELRQINKEVVVFLNKRRVFGFKEHFLANSKLA